MHLAEKLGDVYDGQVRVAFFEDDLGVEREYYTEGILRPSGLCLYVLENGSWMKGKPYLIKGDATVYNEDGIVAVVYADEKGLHYLQL